MKKHPVVLFKRVGAINRHQKCEKQTIIRVVAFKKEIISSRCTTVCWLVHIYYFYYYNTDRVADSWPHAS